MIYKYDTREINSLVYITGSRLISERGVPFREYEFTLPFMQDLIDDNGKLQWTIRDNPKYDPGLDDIDDRYLIKHNPIALTTEEIETRKQAEIRAEVSNQLPDILLNLTAGEEFEKVKEKIAEIKTSIMEKKK